MLYLSLLFAVPLLLRNTTPIYGSDSDDTSDDDDDDEEDDTYDDSNTSEESWLPRPL